ncbi:rhoptry family protein [Mycoplasmopsis glycophila]|uniref:ECM-binding protein homolog n=2 Tax=Mycoplasmopsis glycophila TaxID=171285 RepID=A0A449AUT8_9BACT|nr:GA module-containing protein [Mycoplasmopsis glycophila]VEU70253.1 ECM-binding protein homolog [Mycoplasmopsis glycophila]
MKKFSKLLITSVSTSPLFLVATSAIVSNNGDRVAISSTPDSIAVFNEDLMTFYNPNHYQWNMKGKEPFNVGYNPQVYGNKDYSLATIRPISEKGDKLKDQEEWYEEEQEWEATFNRNPTFVRGEIDTTSKEWSNRPRFSIVISKSLELVPRSMFITAYRSTTSERIFQSIQAPIPVVPANPKTAREKYADINFMSDGAIISDIPIPGSSRKGKLNNFNRWTTSLVYWEGDNKWRLEHKWAINPVYKNLFTDWGIFNPTPDSNPVRAYFSIDNSVLDRMETELNKRGERYFYPPRSITEGSVGSSEGYQHSKKFQDNIGTIFSFGYDTGTDWGTFADQNWFKVTFKTRKNQAYFDAKNPGGLAYVMAGFTTHDQSKYTYSFNWKAAEINADRQNYSIDVREYKTKSTLYKLPNEDQIEFNLVAPGKGTVPNSGIILSGNKTRNDVDSWYSRTFSSLDTKTQNEYLTSNGKDVFETWQLEASIPKKINDIWDIKVSKATRDPEDPYRLIFNVEYTINEFKVERSKAIAIVEDSANFPALVPLQQNEFIQKVRASENYDELRKLIDITNDNSGLIKETNDKMVKLRKMYDDLYKLKEQPDFPEEYRDEIETILEKYPANKDYAFTFIRVEDVDPRIDEIELFWEYLDALESIKNKQNLTPKQKELLKDLVDQKIKDSSLNKADKVTELQNLKNKINDLDDLMQDVKDLKESALKTKETDNYKLSSSENKKVLDQAIENLIKADDSIDKEFINTLTDNVRNAIENLEGVEGLAQAKAKAREALKKLNALNNKQIKQINDKISEAHSIDELKNIIKIEANDQLGSANTLNELMSQLRDLKAKSEAIKNISSADYLKYGQASSNLKDVFNKILQDVTANLELLDLKKDVVQDKINKLKTAYDNLNGVQNLQSAKNNAISKVNDITLLPHLNNKQREELVKEINTQNDVARIKSIIDVKDKSVVGTAKDLDDAMSEFLEELAKSNETKAKDKYINSDSQYKDAFDLALERANQAKELNLSVEQANNLKNNLASARANLNGGSTSEKRDELKEEIENSNVLPPALKEKIKDKLDEADSLEKLKELENTINEIISKLDELKKQNDKASNIINDPNLADKANKELENELKNRVNENNELINDTTANEEYFDLDNPDLIKNKIDELINNTSESLDKFANKAKENAIEKVDSLDNLNNAQKQDFLNRIEANQNDLNKVVALINEATELNDKMSELKNYIDSVIKQGEDKNPLENLNFVDADKELQNKFKETYENALNNLNKDSGANLNLDQISELLNKLKEDFESLNGNKKREDKINALKELVSQSNSIRNSASYKNAAQDKKDEYNNAISNAENILNNPNNFSLQDIEEAIHKIEDALNRIAPNVENLKDKIDNLPNLSPEEKEKFKEQIDNSTSNDQIVDAFNKAKEVNKKKGDLINLIYSKENLSNKDKEQLKEKVKNADSTDQNWEEKLKEAIENANKIIGELTIDITNHNLSNEQLDEIWNKLNEIGINNPDYKKIIDKLKEYNNLASKLDEYKNSNVNDQNYEEIKNKLKELVENNLDVDLEDPKHANLKDQLIKEKEKLNKLANAEMDLVDALLNNDQDKFNHAFDEIHSIDPNLYNTFKQELDQINYFEIVNKDSSDLTKEDIDNLKKITKQDSSDVIYSAIKEANKDNVTQKPSSRLAWLWILLALLAATGTGIIAFAIKKRKDKN